MFGGTLRFLVLYAWIGLTICFAVHAMSFVIVPPGGELVLAGLGFGLMPAYYIVIVLNGELLRNATTANYFESAMPNCPLWMRKVVKVLWFYAGFALFVFGPLAVLQHDPTINPFREPATWRLFSGFLLLFWGATLGMAISTNRAAEGA